MNRQWIAYTCLLWIGPLVWAADNTPKQASYLYPKPMVTAALDNAERFPWAKEIQQRILNRAKPWRETSDEDLWNMIFGPAITRSWMVWSNGVCPSCKHDVKMYSWVIDVWKRPFKVQCPHCDEIFPKNDFAAYYRSGLDEHGRFDPSKADRGLLFSADHPRADDSLRSFGVDDGEGYVEGDQRWRFIGYYLIAGQWRQLLVGGIRNLSEAYLATGDQVYARKAALMLDRVADVYPDFDFKTQGLVYEKSGHQGYVTVWHDACEEVRELAQAYDRVFDAITGDAELVAFLSRKAREFHLTNPKTSFTQIQQNIEDRIFRDTLAHREKIESNFPRTPISLLTLETVLSWHTRRAVVMQMLDQIIKDSVLEDGLTGEKGLSGYTTIFPTSFADLIGRFDRLDENFIYDLFKRHPELYQTYRFHIDTWCLEQFYPREGDCGSFGSPDPNYRGVNFSRPASSTEPSMFRFLGRLYEITHDPVFVQALYKANGNSLEGLPHDLFEEHPDTFQNNVKTVMDAAGGEIRLPDVNKEAWGISILRSGEGDRRRAAWLDHDSGGRHSHHDGLNIGLFAYHFDLLPDFGYPPVGYGGWSAPKAVWYTRTAAHNTVVVDGKEQKAGKGKTTLWGSGQRFHVVRISAPELIEGDQYERTLALVDVSDSRSYAFDLFRVTGGTDHAKFLSSFFGAIQTNGLNVQPAPDYGFNTELRNFRTDPAPSMGWSVDWTVEDRYQVLPSPQNIHLRYTDLTTSTAASLAECWIDSGLFGGKEEWIPRLMIRRQQAQAPLHSCFVSIWEPYEDAPAIQSLRRMDWEEGREKAMREDSGVLEMNLTDGRRHLLAFTPSTSAEKNSKWTQKALGLEWIGDLAWIEIRGQSVERLVLCNGEYLHYGDLNLRLKTPVPFVEIRLIGGKPEIVTGPPDCLAP